MFVKKIICSVIHAPVGGLALVSWGSCLGQLGQSCWWEFQHEHVWCVCLLQLNPVIPPHASSGADMSPDSQSNIICSSVTSPFHDVSPCTVIHQTSWMITKLTLQVQQEMIAHRLFPQRDVRCNLPCWKSQGCDLILLSFLISYFLPSPLTLSVLSFFC